MIWLARFFAVAAILVSASDVISWIDKGRIQLSALGEWWFWAHKDSLQVLQPAIERHVESWLPFTIWDPGVQTLLEWSFAAELGVLATIFYLISLWRR